MKKWFTGILFLLFVAQVSAQIDARMSLDTNWMLVGEQTNLRITLEYPPSDSVMNVEWPVLEDTITKEIEILQKSAIDTTVLETDEEKFLFQQEQKILITAFDSGYFAIPPITFRINGREIETNALLLEVHLADVPPDGQMKDIKDVIELEWTLVDWLKTNLVVVVVVSLVIIILLVLYFTGALHRLVEMLRQKKEKEVEQAPAPPKDPPHITALSELRQLKEDRYWQQGLTKQYYIRLSEILRDYVEGQFGVHAQEETSRDILVKLRQQELDKGTLQNLREVLLLADLVKFAKEKPTPQENESMMEKAFEFVEKTTPEEQPEMNEEERS